MSFINFIRSKVFWRNMGFISLIFIGLLIGVFLGLNVYTRHGQMYELPKVVGYFVDEMDEVEGMQHFKVIVTDSIYTPGEYEGKILTQDPKVGAKVKKGRKIYVIVTSSEGEFIPMPYCLDQSVRSAVNQLTNVGLGVGKFIFNIGDFNNVVVGQRYKGRSIDEGIQIQRGEKIDLVVEMNQERYMTDLPNIIGLTEDEAEKRLWEASLNVGNKEYEGKRDVNHSRVVSFSPKYSTVTKGTTISIKFMNDEKPSYKDRVKSFRMSAPVVVEEEMEDMDN